MSASEYRAQFDAVVTFSNGGGLRADNRYCRQAKREDRGP